MYRFAKQMLAGETVQIFGDGSMRRDFTFVDDIVQGICAAIEWTGTENAYETFNLGTSSSTSVLEIVRTLESELDCSAIVEFGAPRAGDVQETQANIAKAAALLGYQPRTSIEDGIRNFAGWMRKESEFASYGP
jgi:UDP-glucuronate 4-epimerase